MIETDVLIIGTGPSGAAAASLLATYGVKPLVITKWNWTCRTPRAHITNQRAMEVFRDLGIETEVNAKRTAQQYMGNNVFCTSLAGEELGRLLTWGTHPQRMADYTLASPTTICDVPQDLLEPILVGTAASRGATVMFNWEYQSLEQDADGAIVEVKDYVAQTIHKIRAKYVIGADGGRSKVAQDIGLPMEGKMGVAGSMNIVFEADLSKYVAHRPSVLYWIMQPGSDVGGIGMGLVRMVRPWHEWLIVWGYDINQPPPKVTDEMATEIARNLIGDHTIPIRIKATSVWTVNNMYALEHSRGRVFCVGDAVHRHPPSNGLGSNTSIQDSFNLAWKIAYVLRGKAAPSLLDSYGAERALVAKQIVTRANQSITEFGPIFDALGLLSTKDPEQMKANMAKLHDNNPAAAEQREALRKAIAFKAYEFNCHGVEMNQRYASAAVVADGSPEPDWRRDKELFPQLSTRPGAHLPHVWLFDHDNREVSTLDLCGKGCFALFTGIGGEAWAEAAKQIAAETGLDIVAHVIGPGRDYQDYAGDWAVAREIGEAGCILVRPDQFVAWRHATATADAKAKLIDVLSKLLGKPLSAETGAVGAGNSRRSDW